MHKREHSSASESPKRLGAKLEKRLVAYFVAAGATALAAPGLTRADILYTAANTPITPNSTVYLDLNHDGVRDFHFSDVFQSGFSTFTHYFFAFGQLRVLGSQSGNGARGSVGFGGSVYALRLNAGSAIGPGQQFEGKLMALDEFDHCCTFGEGSWRFGATDQFLGLEFLLNGEEHFGWAALNVEKCGSFAFCGTLLGYAYDTVSNQQVLAGEYTSTTPEPGTLALLALGALGLGVWRRKEGGQRS